MPRRPLFCANCGDRTPDGQGLCEKCTVGLDEKHIDSNSVIVEKYTRRGIAQIDLFLEAHAAFERWIADHPTKEEEE